MGSFITLTERRSLLQYEANLMHLSFMFFKINKINENTFSVFVVFLKVLVCIPKVLVYSQRFRCVFPRNGAKMVGLSVLCVFPSFAYSLGMACQKGRANTLRPPSNLGNSHLAFV